MRKGTVWSCIAHIITAVIGAGVLSLAWSTAQLGWIAGPISLLLFAIVTYVSASLLADCYRCPETGTRNYTYMDAVRLNLGTKRTWICGLLQYLSLYGTSIAYVITTATSMRYLNKFYTKYLSWRFISLVLLVPKMKNLSIGFLAYVSKNRFHVLLRGRKASCQYGGGTYMLLFGGVQIIMSQIPDFHSMTWLSVVAAIMSFCYSSIGLVLGLAKVIGNGKIKGTIGGIPVTSTSQKYFLAFQALGDIAFAYPYSLILLEIQDTLKSKPSESKVMKKASVVAVSFTTFFYLCCGCFGYAAFGNDTPGNLLTGFGFFEPFWLIDFANACIILHLVGGYQVFSQPIFAFVERWSMKKFPTSGFVNNFCSIGLPFLPPFQMNLLKLFWRTVYVISSVVLAMTFPYFNQVLGILGALNFWPLAVYFPVEMYIVQKKIGSWTRNWIILQAFSGVCLIVTILVLIGSNEGLIRAKLD